MKKKIFIFLTLFICFLTSCSEPDVEPEEVDCFETFSDGQQDAIQKIKNTANSEYKTYVDVEDLEDIIKIQFGDESDDIRDSLIYHPDLKIYDTADIVDEVIDNTYLY